MTIEASLRKVIQALLRLILAVFVGIGSALATVFSLNSPLPPWGWETNTVVGIVVTTGIALFNVVRLKLSVPVRILLCALIVVIGVTLCVLGFSSEGPMMKSLLTLTILAAAISVGGTLAVMILRSGTPRNTAPREVTPETRRRIGLLFSKGDVELVEAFLEEECGNNLPFLENLTAFQLERYRFAALKLSQGNILRLQAAVELAKQDWRDLLVAADFASDTQAHQSWQPAPRKTDRPDLSDQRDDANF